jgi:hypothetical protein|tara:strand:+ start:2969 stop:3550 length:582 start_codon:yes stop_codon:yes gene_type:complete
MDMKNIMEVNMTNKTLIHKVFDIQSEIGSVEKTDGGGVPYKVLAYNDVNKKVREQLIKHRVCMIPNTTQHSRNGNFTEVLVGVTLYDVDNPSDTMEINDFVGYGVDPSDKGIGKAYSYGYKYLFMKLFNMNIGKDEESEDKSPLRDEPVTDKNLVALQNAKDKEKEMENQLKTGGMQDGKTNEKQFGKILQSS